MFVREMKMLAQILAPSYNNLRPRTDGRTYGRRRIAPGPRPPPIPDSVRACTRILYREVTSSVPPLHPLRRRWIITYLLITK